MKRCRLLLIASLFVIKLAAQIDSKDLVLDLPFNGNAKDMSGNHYNGIINGATLTAGADNQPNTAYYFNGVNSSIIIPNITALDGQLKAFTILVRMMPMDIVPQPDVQDPYAAAYNFLTWHRNTTDSLQAFLNSKMRTTWQPPSSGGEAHKVFLNYIMNWCSGNSGTASGYLKDSALVDHKWVTVAYVFDNGIMKIFHNCKTENYWENIYPPVSDLCGNEPMQISLGNVPQGAFQYGYRYFKGNIDDLRIYTRALSDDEVKWYADTLCKEETLPEVNPSIAIYPDPCKPDNYLFTNASTVKDFIIAKRAWKIDDSEINEAADSLIYQFNSIGTHTIQLTLQGKDTAFSTSASIHIDSLKPIRFLSVASAAINVCENSSMQLQVSGGNTYNWEPCTYLSNCTVGNPVITPKDFVLYKVRATNENRCNDSLTLQVKVVPDNATAFVPKAFTPNGDGLNDAFGALSFSQLTGLRFTIYNNFGQAVFTNNDKQDKWNGKYKNIDQPAGTYIWTLQYQGGNGCSIKMKKGTVQLIR